MLQAAGEKKPSKEKEANQAGRFKGGKIFRLSSRYIPNSHPSMVGASCADKMPGRSYPTCSGAACKGEPSKPETRGVETPAPPGGSHNEGSDLEGWEDPRERDDHPRAPPPSPARSAAFEIRPSKLGGLGAFAVRTLKKGETVLVEKPLLWTTHFRLMRDFNNLSESGKAAYLGLHGGEGGNPFNRVERIKTRNA